MPDVNEAHYLSKARHYWDADWCPDDFFCNSADAHQVFYWTFGWLSRVAAAAGDGLVRPALDLGPVGLGLAPAELALVPAAYYSVLSAALLVTLVDRCPMAGEWIIGGVEAKGFAYVFVLLGLEALVRDRWGPALVLFGAASAFHVIIGGWSVVAAARGLADQSAAAAAGATHLAAGNWAAAGARRIAARAGADARRRSRNRARGQPDLCL